jgi:hypothetical protein
VVIGLRNWGPRHNVLFHEFGLPRLAVVSNSFLLQLWTKHYPALTLILANFLCLSSVVTVLGALEAVTPHASHSEWTDTPSVRPSWS